MNIQNKFLLTTILIFLVAFSVNAAFWDEPEDIGPNDYNNITWQTSSTPDFTYFVNGNRTDWGNASIMANNVWIDYGRGATNNTYFTWAATSYGDCDSTTCIEFNVTLCQGDVCETSASSFFGVDSNAPNITNYWPLDLAKSDTTLNSFNFTGDDINNKTVELYLTDNETWFGNIHPFEALKKYRSKFNKEAKLAVLAFRANEFTIADPSDAGMMDIAGLDANVPKILSEFAAGRL